ncbi:MAG: TIGR03435 family protein [Acidobacteriaceae bacterium]|nr:TIGR03435 family protein [Acidobacteriaceae bacterium]
MNGSRLLSVFVLLGLSPLARPQQFATVLIKPSATSTPGSSRLQILPSGNLIGNSIPVVELIALAYVVPSNPSPRLASLPEWAVRLRFDIQAQTSAPLKLETKDIPAQRRIIERFLQKFLSDRLGLVLGVKTIATPVYALTLSRSNHKLMRAQLSPRDCIFDTGPHGCHSFAISFGHPLNTRAADMFDLAHYLENWTDLPVVDRTAEIGLFEMHSQGWQPMNLPPPPPGASGTGAEFAPLPTLSAVLSSFGLELHRAEENLPFYTVKRLNQPR